jgi:hypothetical protein
MGDGGRRLPCRGDAIDVGERHLGIEEAFLASVQLLFCPLAVMQKILNCHSSDAEDHPGE